MSKKKYVQRHAVTRISPLGEMFVGKCLVCDKENIQLHQTVEECPNPNNIDVSQVIQDYIIARAKKERKDN